MAQAATHWSLTLEARLQSMAELCEMCWGMAQAATHWSLTLEARLQSMAELCEMCWG